MAWENCCLSLSILSTAPPGWGLHTETTRERRHPSSDTDSAHDYLKPCQLFRPFPLQSSPEETRSISTKQQVLTDNWAEDKPLCLSAERTSSKLFPVPARQMGNPAETDTLNVGGKILISLSWHLCCPALKSSLGRGKTTSSMEEDPVTQPILHLAGNHWEEKASLIPIGKYP